jgi:hypothetical protein
MEIRVDYIRVGSPRKGIGGGREEEGEQWTRA